MPKYSLNDYDMSRREKKVTCPWCGGTGMNNDTLDSKCYHCYGTKRVSESEAKRYKY